MSILEAMATGALCAMALITAGLLLWLPQKPPSSSVEHPELDGLSYQDFFEP